MEHAGHKIQALPSIDGKITAAQVEEVACGFEASTVPEHIVQPKMVYLSYTSEFGTLYSKRELEDLSAVCREHGCTCSWTAPASATAWPRRSPT